MASRRPAADFSVPVLTGQLGALGPGEELVPRPEQGTAPVHDHRIPPGPGGQRAQRPGVHDRQHLRAAGHGQPGHRRPVAVAQRSRHRGQQIPLAPGGLRRLGRPVEQQGALGQHQVHVLAQRDLDGRVVLPPGHRVAPRLDPELPPPLGRDRDVGAAPVGARGELAHHGQRQLAAVRRAHHYGGAEPLVALAEDLGADLEGLACYRLGRSSALVRGGLHVEDGNSAYHAATLPILAAATRTRLPRLRHTFRYLVSNLRPQILRSGR
jgi:hypothetical protein